MARRGSGEDWTGHGAAPVGHSGYHSTHESMLDDPWDGDDPDFDYRSTGPGIGQRVLEILRRHETRYWAVRGVAAFALLLILIVAWLTITAPLSKSLEPIAPPRMPGRE